MSKLDIKEKTKSKQKVNKGGERKLKQITFFTFWEVFGDKTPKQGHIAVTNRVIIVYFGIIS
jgi:hypothetical protein